jgi:Arc-like DNA binding domain
MARKLADTVQLTLRFSEKLRRRLERAAESNAQSMNSEINQRLERSFDRQDMLAEALALIFGDGIAALLRKRGDDLQLKDLLSRIGRDAQGSFDYDTYVAVNKTLGLTPGSRAEWEEGKRLPAPTDAEFEAMKAAHGVKE